MCKLRFEYSNKISEDKKQLFEDSINQRLSFLCEEMNKVDGHIQVSFGKDGISLRGLIIGPESLKLSLQNRNIDLEI
jgi:hypothetical protein